MGEVYRATDTKLGRDVALKVLPEAFAKNGERMARFRREAKVLASLNHPNIATIHGLEESNGNCALVMELVEGPTLAERIIVTPRSRPPGEAVAPGFSPARADLKVGATTGARGAPLPIDESLHIAKQIAEGLEYAHERGVIHRDLKPANVKVRPDGTVKILDFGLAKALEETPAAGSISDSPTISAAASRDGIILGTAAYMSPEQARGKAVDRRCDIWSFGAVLFEMLSGKQAFAGEDVSHTLAAVIMKEPDWSVLPDRMPPPVGRLLRRCLTKDPKQRLRDIGEARIAIESCLAGTGNVGAAFESAWAEQAPPLQVWRRALPWGVATATLAVALAGMSLWVALQPAVRPATRPIARFVVTLPPGDRLALGNTPAVSLSPDGSRLVYVANHGGGTQLYVRAIGRFEATPVPGTEGAEIPFFSPDGRSVGFFAGGKLKKVSLSGGAPLTICSAPASRGASWGSDGTIILAPSLSLGLFQVSAAGGTPKPLSFPDRKKGELSHRWPQILPGNKEVLFTIWTGNFNWDYDRIGVLSLETGERRVLLEGGTYARYVPSGHLVYARAGELLAVPFDLKQLEVTGPSVSMVQGISVTRALGVAQFSLSGDGSFAYVPGGSSVSERTLLWVDRKGASRPLLAPARAYGTPRLSPDGRRLAVGIYGAPGLWLYDLARGALTRLTESTLSPHPIWTPDGERVTFASLESGVINLYRMPVDGSSGAERLTTSENGQWPGSWSPDGRMLAFTEADPTTGYDLWVLKLEGDRKPRPFLQTPSNESGPIFSPDGRWLAYVSDESGRQEIYVRPFPGPGGKMQISTEGGNEPMWARNGRELFYRNGDKMMVTAVETQGVFAASQPKQLFEGHYETSYNAFERDYDISPDRQEFLMVKAAEQESPPTQLNVVLNWSDELRRLAPAGKP
jgi:serine/threonine-protein kinase